MNFRQKYQLQEKSRFIITVLGRAIIIVLVGFIITVSFWILIMTLIYIIGVTNGYTNI